MESVTNNEAWNLFRIAAISEAVSWLLLLTGMYFKYLVHPGTDTLVAIGGSIHGIVFLAYAAAVLFLCKILNLTVLQTLIAAAASVIPFGTLVFERWLAHKRALHALGGYRELVVRAVISNKDKILALQTEDVSFWSLPGGVVLDSESAQQALIRTLTLQTGITPIVGPLYEVFEYRHHAVRRLELLFSIQNSKDYLSAQFDQETTQKAGIERIDFIALTKKTDFKPAFLIDYSLHQPHNPDYLSVD